MKKKLTILLLIIMYVPLSAQTYKIEQEIDINGALEITNMNSLYNQIGVHYIGNGYYVSTSGATYGRFNPRISALHQAEDYINSINSDNLSINFSSMIKTGSNSIAGNYIYVGEKKFFKYVFRLLIDGYNISFPYLSRTEAISRAKENKELLELGLINKKKYDYDLFFIKKILNQ
ncbi:hypothetical protein [Polaribacter tangerinus]|uniref:hypothetical protein n=1 Tax=Polaribacter tangerinus TaxID=1920034 RepID=UPI000B4B90C0|nr:hypothetical protein [Polaribacter tangerinus]